MFAVANARAEYDLVVGAGIYSKRVIDLSQRGLVVLLLEEVLKELTDLAGASIGR